MKVSDAHGSAQTVGSFPDDARARAAVQRLREAGVVAGAISVAHRSEPAKPPSEMPTFSRVFWSGFWWSIVGGIVGAAVGLVIGLLGLGLPGTPDNIAVHVASWAMFLHVAGALAGCYAVLDTGDRFARKADHHDASATLVRVRSKDTDSLARAERILADAGASHVEHPGAVGVVEGRPAE